ncbi:MULTISPECIES: ADP-ribosylglycohydrolase family protein [unclassified Halomonas]|uniref:ADP-ribosylglycohydrolase family protein n=1 Tax=Halomonas sp. RT37 TaxID=2950872 RepID=A0AAU7KNY0_9GAMM|nr:MULTISPECIES: ADP-ribosylglycohydrolase family protein [unclassified Halomonas]MBY6111964.1 ADP-ribosylglycohydrolase family protein [Halomonas sp. DP1Y21-3]RQW69906.1 ADP-ribosylglycohydrolase family protein [Halomonas sp. YLB-10]
MKNKTHEIRQKFVGCLLGGAVGDALGAPVEFITHVEIVSKFGESGITEYVPCYGGIGRITDDTQMVLFTAEGLLRGHVRGARRGICHIASVISSAYERWLYTQGYRSRMETGEDWLTSGWLAGHAELQNQRAPGRTCISALRSMERYGASAKNNSKGCGGLMRVAPCGLFIWPSTTGSDAFHLGMQAASITHGHPSGYLTAGVLSELILHLINGKGLRDSLGKVKEALVAYEGHEETLDALEKAEALADISSNHFEAISKLGQGWVAEEALSIAVYCALVAKDLRHGVCLAVNHDGDSDSTGAIAGNLLGAMMGVSAIPESWLEPLELRDVITEMAEDLVDSNEWDLDDFGGVDNDWVWKKYPGY